MKRNASAATAAWKSDPEKTVMVEQERARLMGLFAGADENKLDFIRDAVQQLAWINISIQDLQKDIDENGPVVPYQNGQTQKGLQANPSCKLLIDLQKLSNTTFRALLPVLPEKVDTIDPFAEYKITPMTEEEKEAEYNRQMAELEQIRNGKKIYD